MPMRAHCGQKGTLGILLYLPPSAFPLEAGYLNESGAVCVDIVAGY